MAAQERGTLRFGRSDIAYAIERSARRNTLTIAVDLRRGVVVRAPRELTVERIAEVVRRKAPWILRRLAEFSELPTPPLPREFINGEGFLYLGRHYRLKVRRTSDGAGSVKLWGGWFNVALPEGGTDHDRPGRIRLALVAWYKERARMRLTERVALFAERLGDAPPPVHIRGQEKRWGSCSHKGELRFNWRVIMAPLPLVDYVVAHEVCHLKLKNHSNAFWRLLRRLMPDYEQRRARLRVMGVQFQL
jgi:predicted metal-dependent hydrolase